MTWETIRDLIRDEWLILGLLLLWSLAGLTIICERVYSLWNALPKAEAFKDRVVAALEAKDIAKATALCETSGEPLADVFEKGLKTFKKYPEKTTNVVTSQRLAATARHHSSRRPPVHALALLCFSPQPQGASFSSSSSRMLLPSP